MKHLGIFNKIFGGSSSIDSEIKRACDSDIFENIAKVIDGDKSKYDNVIGYLNEKGNLSMKLRVMTFPIAETGSLMAALMALKPSDSKKINKLCKDKLNPVLHFCMYKGMEEHIRVLAQANANLDIVGLKRHTPLTMACKNGLTETVKVLINGGARAFDKRDDAGFAPLHYACQLGIPEMVESLIKAGANVNVMSADKLMPIHLAISTAQAARMSPTAPNGLPRRFLEAFKCVQHLYENEGADLNYVCPYGFSAMDFLLSVGVAAI